MHMRCTATMDHLPGLLDLADRACAAASADEAACYAVRLAVEEVVVNVVIYGYEGREPGPVDLRLSWDDERVTIRITDEAGPFSPDDAPAPDLESDWGERAIGGLGWHLVRSMVDELRHRYDPADGNHYTLVKAFARQSTTQETPR